MFFNAKQKVKKLINEFNFDDAIKQYRLTCNMWKSDNAKMTVKDTKTGEVFIIRVGEMKKLTADIVKDWEFVAKQKVIDGKLGCYSLNQALLAARFEKIKAEIMNNGDTKNQAR